MTWWPPPLSLATAAIATVPSREAHPNGASGLSNSIEELRRTEKSFKESPVPLDASSIFSTPAVTAANRRARSVERHATTLRQLGQAASLVHDVQKSGREFGLVDECYERDEVPNGAQSRGAR